MTMETPSQGARRSTSRDRNGEDVDRRLGLELFEALVELARMDEESRGRLGRRFLDEAASAIEDLALLDGIRATVGRRRWDPYTRAEAVRFIRARLTMRDGDGQ